MKLGWIIICLLGILSTPPRVDIVRHDSQAIIVSIVPTTCKISIYRGCQQPSVLSFNANYFDPKTGRPIGIILDKGVYKSYLWDRTTNMRPCLVFTKQGKPFICRQPWVSHRHEMWVAVQGGPTLLEHGKIVNRIHEERLEGEPICVGRQVSVGIDRKGKLFVIYSRNWSMRSISVAFQKLNCIDAMKFDGGPSSHLSYEDHTLGNPYVVTGLMFQAK